jgi:hypothetical protein
MPEWLARVFVAVVIAIPVSVGVFIGYLIWG